MLDIDRTAIHEVMEQGRVTIAKAGIHAKLNARCSVLAAANPVYGRYDQTKTPMENIGMQDSLLSRFDLLFILLDKNDEATDGKIADHVLLTHRYRNEGESDGAVLPMGPGNQVLSTESMDDDDDEPKETELFEKNAGWLPNRNREDKVLSLDFIKKYIQVAKRLNPILSKVAADFISQQFVELRQSEIKKNEKERTTPVTARTLETMIRLATAHAKCRMSKTISIVDARKAYDILYTACFKEAPKKIAKKKRQAESEDEQDEVSEAEDEPMEQDLPPGNEAATSSSQKRAKRTREKDVYDFSEGSSVAPAGDFASKRRRVTSGVSSAPAISVDKYKTFMSHVRRIFDEQTSQALSVELVSQLVHQRGSFTDDEIEAALSRMGDENQIMISDGMMIII